MKEMDTKKIMATFAILMIALSVAGFAYSMWSETLVIQGIVEMANLDVDLSLYGVWEDGLGENLKSWVANTTAELSADNKTLTITVENAYPSYVFEIVFDIHCEGAMPAKLTNFEGWGNLTYANGTEVELTEVPDWLYTGWALWLPGYSYPVDDPNYTGDNLCDIFQYLEGLQLEQCDMVTILLYCHIYEDLSAEPPIEPPQGALLEFGFTFDAVQYNEYVPP
jgi:hypothetical protein